MIDFKIIFDSRLKKWFIFPKQRGIDYKKFILDMTSTKSLDQAHMVLGKIIGYELDSVYISPGFRRKKDAEKVVNYFYPDPLFE